MFSLFKKPFGLHIDAGKIHAAEVKNNKIWALGSSEIPEGILTHNSILNEGELCKLLEKTKEEAKPNVIKNKKCILSLPWNYCFENVYFFPSNLKDGELENSLKVKMSEEIPLSFSDMVFDYVVTNNKEQKSIYVVAAKKSLIEMYYKFLKKCKLKPIKAEPASLGIVRTISNKIKESEPTVIVCPEGDNIKWMLFWQNGVVDSNLIKTGEFISDLKDSIKEFTKRNNIKVSNLFLFESSSSSSLKERIKQELGVDASLIKNTIVLDKTLVKGDCNDRFPSIGASLIGAKEVNNININLFKGL